MKLNSVYVIYNTDMACSRWTSLIVLPVVFLATAGYGAASNTRECDRLYNWFIDLKTTNLRLYSDFTFKFNNYFGVDGNDLAAVRTLLCKLADAETLNEVLELLSPGHDREAYRELYKNAQKYIADYGGYTSWPRILSAKIDFPNILLANAKMDTDAKDRLLSLGREDSWKIAKRVSEMFDLPALTRVFEVMQVKYGSRWLNSIVCSPKMDCQIKDPAKFAESLYQSNSCKADDVTNNPEVSSLPLEKYLLLCRILLDEQNYIETRNNADWAATMVLFGEIGLFTLKT